MILRNCIIIINIIICVSTRQLQIYSLHDYVLYIIISSFILLFYYEFHNYNVYFFSTYTFLLIKSLKSEVYMIFGRETEWHGFIYENEIYSEIFVNDQFTSILHRRRINSNEKIFFKIF